MVEEIEYVLVAFYRRPTSLPGADARVFCYFHSLPQCFLINTKLPWIHQMQWYSRLVSPIISSVNNDFVTMLIFVVYN